MNILLVDDDQFVIRKMAEVIDWESIGIKRVFTAENVQQARRIFETFPVDILVTDIEMPQGSGLELLEWVQEQKYPVETLVLSGYAHFAYVQKAMQYGGRKYLLKPISNKELVAAIKEIVQEKGSKNVISDKRKAVLAVCQELYSRPLDQIDLVRECVEKRGIYRGDEKFCIVILRIFSNGRKGETDQKLLQFVVQNVIQEFFENKGLELELDRQDEDGEWLLVFRKNGRLSDLQEYTIQMQNCLKEMVYLDSCVYIGRVCGLSEVTQSYAALKEMCGEVVPDEQGIFSEEAWLQKDQRTGELPDFEALEKRMAAPDQLPLVKEELMEYIRLLSQGHKATVVLFRDFLDGLMDMVYRLLRQRDIMPSQMFNENELSEGRRRAGCTVRWMLEFLEYLFGKLEGIWSVNSSKREYLVDKLKRYISEHLDEELSRKRLAEIVHLSEDYVSKLFSAEVGMSIPNYVAGQRMERAKHYLADTKMTVSQVAMKVGYSNFSYFSKTFKDYTGNTPNEYRCYNKKT